MPEISRFLGIVIRLGWGNRVSYSTHGAVDEVSFAGGDDLLRFGAGAVVFLFADGYEPERLRSRES